MRPFSPWRTKRSGANFFKNRETDLHHIKFLVPDHAPINKHIKLNVLKSAVGKNAGSEWLYYDTEEQPGFCIETMNELKK